MQKCFVKNKLEKKQQLRKIDNDNVNPSIDIVNVLIKDKQGIIEVGWKNVFTSIIMLA